MVNGMEGTGAGVVGWGAGLRPVRRRVPSAAYVCRRTWLRGRRVRVTDDVVSCFGFGFGYRCLLPRVSMVSLRLLVLDVSSALDGLWSTYDCETGITSLFCQYEAFSLLMTGLQDELGPYCRTWGQQPTILLYPTIYERPQAVYPFLPHDLGSS